MNIFLAAGIALLITWALIIPLVSLVIGIMNWVFKSSHKN